MPKGLISNIQYLRALAALAVVFVHATAPDGLKMGVAFGKFGVDIFFVISGFIMCQITSSDASHFFMKRLIRIVPTYWAVTLLLFATAMVMPSFLHHTTVDLKTLFYSLFFIPHDRASQAQPWPLLQVGWTLNYEMYFYAIFAVALLISRRFSQLLCALAVIGVVVATWIINPSSPAEAFYGQPIALDFVYGMAVYQIFRRSNWATKPAPRMDAGAFAAIAVLVAAAVWLPYQEVRFGDPLEFLTGGVAAAFVLAAAVLLELRYKIFGRNNWILLLGEASYILYLIHQFVMFGIIRVGLRHAVNWPDLVKWPLIALMLVITSVVAMILHYYIERPAMKWLRQRLVHEPPPVIFQKP